jgi:hypothetical protein
VAFWLFPPSGTLCAEETARAIGFRPIGLVAEDDEIAGAAFLGDRIEGLIEKGLAVEDKKGVTLIPKGYALITR